MQMAITTINVDVCAEQWKTGQEMVKILARPSNATTFIGCQHDVRPAVRAPLRQGAGFVGRKS